MSVAEDLQTRVTTNGVSLHVVESGPGGGPPVILLHGFPEFWFAWRHQIGPLADAGFRTLAVDQRGYNTSDKPANVGDYQLDTLADDVIGLIEWTVHERATLVGHDWGGIVAWWAAVRHPERVKRLAVLNAPHPAAMKSYLKSSPRQLLKSWYTFAFQLPWVPEAVLGRNGAQPLVDALRGSSRPGTFSDADLDFYRRAWSQPGALRSMIHWYRAAMRRGPNMPESPRVACPTLVIWGMNDQALEPGLADRSLALCDHGRLERLEQATHWVQHEEPERVNRLLIDFLNEPGWD